MKAKMCKCAFPVAAGIALLCTNVAESASFDLPAEQHEAVRAEIRALRMSSLNKDMMEILLLEKRLSFEKAAVFGKICSDKYQWSILEPVLHKYQQAVTPWALMVIGDRSVPGLGRKRAAKFVRLYWPPDRIRGQLEESLVLAEADWSKITKWDVRTVGQACYRTDDSMTSELLRALPLSLRRKDRHLGPIIVRRTLIYDRKGDLYNLSRLLFAIDYRPELVAMHILLNRPHDPGELPRLGYSLVEPILTNAEEKPDERERIRGTFQALARIRHGDQEIDEAVTTIKDDHATRTWLKDLAARGCPHGVDVAPLVNAYAQMFEEPSDAQSRFHFPLFAVTGAEGLSMLGEQAGSALPHLDSAATNANAQIAGIANIAAAAVADDPAPYLDVVARMQWWPLSSAWPPGTCRPGNTRGSWICFGNTRCRRSRRFSSALAQTNRRYAVTRREISSHA